MNYKIKFEELHSKNEILSKQLDLINKLLPAKSCGSSNQFFRTIVVQLSEALHTDFIIIGRREESGFKVIYEHGNKEIYEKYATELLKSYDTKNLNKKNKPHKEKAINPLLDGLLLQKMQVEEYSGIPLFNSEEKANGILICLYKKAVQKPVFAESILSLAGHWLGAEIENELTFGNLELENTRLKEQNETIKLLFEHAGASIYYFNPEGILIFQNSSPSGYLTTSNRNAIGKSVDELFGKQEGDLIYERIKKAIKKESSLRFETQIDVADEKKWIKSIYQPIKNEHNKIVGVQLISRDITSDKEAQNKLVERERNYSNLVEITNNLILKTDKNGRITFINRSSNEIYGIKPEDCIGLSIIDFIFHEDRENTIRIFNELSGSNKSQYYFENRQVHKDGSNRPLYWNVSVRRNKEGQVLDFTSIGSEITGIKNREKDLIDAKLKAEARDRLKSAFLANMSHEIRNPMNSILGFTDLISDEEFPAEKRKYFANIIKSSSQQLLNLISDIIDISKIEAEEFTLSYTEFDINVFINEMVDQARLYLTQKNKEHLTIEKSIDSPHKFIRTDRSRLSQIILNLLTNAIKNTNSGSIKLGVEMIDNSTLKILVKDTGIGIDESKHKIIFQRFRQATKEDSLKEGSGLGLAICKVLVDKLGGVISVQSSIGEGALFEVILPIKTSDALCPEESNSKFKECFNISNNFKILIAEDEEINFLYLKEVLSHQAIIIKHAWNGKEAIKIFDDEEPDLVLMDIRMPKIDGFQAFREIRKKNQDTPIIALTACALSNEEKEILDSGFDHYLSKPVSKDKLLKTIQHITKNLKLQE